MTNNDPLIGKTFRGEYVIESELGVGGMGAVYKASQQSLNRVVAIKVMNIQLARQTGFAERFAREAQTSALLEHPNIIPIYDYGQQDGYVYLVMRLLTGHSLAERLSAQLESDHPLPNLSEVTHLIKQIASALDYAHAKGVIHRDIKPSNIMFDETGRPYLVDFGIAKLLSANSGLTGTGVAMGTPNFMPPEQWRSDPVTPATDQYALGVIVYNILTGKLPFEGDTPFALMHKHLHEYPTPPHEQRAELPEKVSPILMRAMAKNPAERYATCTDFADALISAESGYMGVPTNFFTIQLPPKTPAYGGYIPKPPSPPPVGAKNRRGAIIGILGMMSLLVLAGIIFLIGNNNSQPPATDITATATVGEVVILPSDTFAPMTPTEILSPPPQPTATETPTVDVLTAIAQIDATNTALVPMNLTATAGAWTSTPTPDLTATIDAIMSGRTATLVVTESIATNIAQKATDQVFIDQTATLMAIDRVAQQAIIDQLATQVALDAIATQIALDQTATATLWTPTPTFTPTVTPTPTPTFTPTPTATPTATPTPIAPDAILGRVINLGSGVLNMRQAPSVDDDIVAVAPNDTVLILTGRDELSQWVFGTYPTADGFLSGWVTVEFLTITDALGNPVTVADVLPVSNNIVHIVQEGETPFSIATSYGVSLESVLRANNLTEETAILLQIGQPLIIELPVEETTTQPIASVEVSSIVLEGHTGNIWAEEISGGRIVSFGTYGSSDTTIRIWDSDGGLITDHMTDVYNVYELENGHFLSTEDTGTILLWDANGQLLKTITEPEGNVSIGLWAGGFISSGEDGIVRLWDTDGNLLVTMTGHTSYVSVLELSDGRILTYGVDGTIHIWDTDGNLLATMTGHTGSVSVHELSDGRILTNGEDGTPHLWDTDGNLLATMGHTGRVYARELSDGRILTNGTDGNIHIWDTDGNLLATMTVHSGYFNLSELSNGRILTNGEDGNIHIWDTDGNLLATMTGHTGYFNPSELSNGRILTVGDDGTLRLWDTDGNLLATMTGHTSSVFASELSNGRILTYGHDGSVRLWDGDGNLLTIITDYGNSSRVRELNDGRILTWGGSDTTLSLWDADGNLLNTLEGHGGARIASAIQLDNGRILSWSYNNDDTAIKDYTLRIWDVGE